MKAEVSIKEIIQEVAALSGSAPKITIVAKTFKFRVDIRMAVVPEVYARSGVKYCRADDDSVELALLRAYQKMFDLPKGHFLESCHSGACWDFDPETEGWKRRR